MPLTVLIVLLGASGLALAWVPYRRLAGAGVDDEPATTAWDRWAYPTLAGMVLGAGGLLWIGLGDWRAPLALLVGALCVSSARAVSHHISLLAAARGSSTTQLAFSAGAAAGLVQGGLLLTSAACLYLLVAFNPAHFVDFTGFILGAILATLLVSPDGVGTKWLQPIAAALVASFALAVLLPAPTTMLLGPQAELLVLPLALVATAFLCNGLTLAMLMGGVAGSGRSPWISAALFLALGFLVLWFMDVYWQLWLCLAAGVIGGLVLLLVRAGSAAISSCLTVGVNVAVVGVAWLTVPGPAYGVGVAVLGMLSGFSLYPALEQGAGFGTRLSLGAGWLATLLLALASLKFIFTLSPDTAEWSTGHWVLAAMPAGSILVCLLLVPLLLDWGGLWHKTRMNTICGDAGCRINLAARLHLFVALLSSIAHLLTQAL